MEQEVVIINEYICPKCQDITIDKDIATIVSLNSVEVLHIKCGMTCFCGTRKVKIINETDN